MKQDYEVNVIKRNGKLMYDFSNPLINSIMADEDAPNIIVVNESTFLVTKEYSGYMKGEVIIDKEFINKSLKAIDEKESERIRKKKLPKRKSVDNKRREYLRKERRIDDLVTQAEKLIKKDTKEYFVTAHIEKMENKLQDAIDLNYYNLQAYYIDLGSLYYKLAYQFNAGLSPLCEVYYLEALKTNKDSQNARIGLIQYYLKTNNKVDAIKYINQLEKDEDKNRFLNYI